MWNRIRHIKTLLLTNRGAKQTILKNTLWLTISEFVDRVLKFALVVYTVRVLGAAEYGVFAFALSLCSLFVILADLGLGQITTRELSKDPNYEKDFSYIISLKLFLSVITFIIIISTSYFVATDSKAFVVTMIMAVFVICYYGNDNLYAFLRARQKMEYEAFARITASVLTATGGILILYTMPSAKNLAYAYSASACFVFFVLLLIFNYRVVPIRLHVDLAIWKRYLSISWPLAVAFISASVYSYMASVMMGAWGQMEATGYFNAAYRIVFVTMMPMALITRSFFPMLCKYSGDSSRDKLQKTWNYYAAAMLCIAIPVVAGGIVIAPKMIPYVFGRDFGPAVLVFQIMIIVTGLALISEPFNQILVVFNKQRKIFWITIIGAALNIVLNAIVIPRYSLYGAAAVTVITYLVMCILYMSLTKKYALISINMRRFMAVLVSIVFSCGLMIYTVTHLMNAGINVLVTVGVGAAVYMAVMGVLFKLTVTKFGWTMSRQEAS